MKNNFLQHTAEILAKRCENLTFLEHPRLLSSSSWDQMFTAVENLVAITNLALLQAFDRVGLEHDMEDFEPGGSKQMRFKSKEVCEFVEEKKKEVVLQSSGTSTGVSGVTDKVVRTVTEYVWKMTLSWELVLVTDGNVEKFVLLHNVSDWDIITTSNAAPKAKVKILDSLDCNCTLLFGLIDEDGKCRFRIERDPKTCRTPLNNKQLRELISVVGDVGRFCSKIVSYLKSHKFSRTLVDVFVPVVPFSLVHSPFVVNCMIGAHEKSLEDAVPAVECKEEKLSALFQHMEDICVAMKVYLLPTYQHFYDLFPYFFHKGKSVSL